MRTLAKLSDSSHRSVSELSYFNFALNTMLKLNIDVDNLSNEPLNEETDLR